MKRISQTMQQKLIRGYKTKSLNQLSRETGLSVMGIRNALVRKGIIMRPRGDPMRRLRTPDKLIDRMVALAKAGETLESIALETGRNESTVSRWLKERGVSMLHERLKANAAQPGRYISAEGYVKIRVNSAATDPILLAMGGKGGSVSEHRYVMAKLLGRPLEKWESVHHIDGDKKNNSPDNLQLRIGQHGKNIAYVCAKCGCSHLRPVELDSPMKAG